MIAKSIFAVCAIGSALVAAAGPREMPGVFRTAAKSPGGVMSYVTALEDEAFRTGNRSEVEAQRWNVQGMIFQIDRFRDRDLLLTDVAEWLLPSAERGRTGAALVNLGEATGEAKYLDAARRIAETYIRLQGEDGTPIGKVARQPAGGDWLGCLQADEWALGLLAHSEPLVVK